MGDGSKCPFLSPTAILDSQRAHLFMLVLTAKDRFTKGPHVSQHLVDSLTQTPEKTITPLAAPEII